MKSNVVIVAAALAALSLAPMFAAADTTPAPAAKPAMTPTAAPAAKPAMAPAAAPAADTAEKPVAKKKHHSKPKMDSAAATTSK